MSDAQYTLRSPLPYSFSDETYPYWYYSPYPEENYYGGLVLEGTGTTDANGELVITLPADLLDEAPDGSRQITIEAVVTDVSNQIVAAQAPTIFHAADGYVGVAGSNTIYQANEEAAVDVITVDWASEPGRRTFG